jgi:hypothetical protein
MVVCALDDTIDYTVVPNSKDSCPTSILESATIRKRERNAALACNKNRFDFSSRQERKAKDS